MQCGFMYVCHVCAVCHVRGRARACGLQRKRYAIIVVHGLSCNVGIVHAMSMFSVCLFDISNPSCLFVYCLFVYVLSCIMYVFVIVSIKSIYNLCFYQLYCLYVSVIVMCTSTFSIFVLSTGFLVRVCYCL